MCNCGSPIRTITTFASNRVQPQTEVIDGDCPYTKEQLEAWVNLLVCCKDKALYRQIGLDGPTLNKYLGITQSALHYLSNICYYQKDLDNISTYIILIQGLEQCQL